MNRIVILFAVLIASVLGQDNSVYSITPNKEELLKIANDTLDHPSILYKDVCYLSEDDWELIKPIFVQYTVSLKTVSYETGTFNLTALDTIFTPEQRDYFFAAQCDEEYNMEEDMDSKIAVIVKGYQLRVGDCGNLLDKEEACKENVKDNCDDETTIASSEIFESRNANKKRSHGKKLHSKKSHGKRSKSKKTLKKGSHLKKSHGKSIHAKRTHEKHHQ